MIWLSVATGPVGLRFSGPLADGGFLGGLSNVVTGNVLIGLLARLFGLGSSHADLQQ